MSSSCLKIGTRIGLASGTEELRVAVAKPGLAHYCEIYVAYGSILIYILKQPFGKMFVH